ncbi:hypothetical protein PUN28_014748 [Cardiocondyla obscurior]|uniref:Uncharacterized protein n=1 Tax=Cardiocondyla obscurior TaxID=286306 RepID=A0AAW2EV76_9HYME
MQIGRNDRGTEEEGQIGRQRVQRWRKSGVAENETARIPRTARGGRRGPILAHTYTSTRHRPRRVVLPGSRTQPPASNLTNRQQHTPVPRLLRFPFGTGFRLARVGRDMSKNLISSRRTLISPVF